MNKRRLLINSSKTDFLNLKKKKVMIERIREIIYKYGLNIYTKNFLIPILIHFFFLKFIIVFVYFNLK